jgi:hypothetical protein
MSDMYSIHCGRCQDVIGVCPGIQPMPSIYCQSCEPAIREEMSRGSEENEGGYSE